jgi:hypothetical protein
MTSRRIGSAIAVVLVVAGCQNPWMDDPINTEQAILGYGWVKPRTIAGEPVYCYRTLAEVDCYREPRPEYAHRLVGYFGTRSPYRPEWLVPPNADRAEELY